MSVLVMLVTLWWWRMVFARTLFSFIVCQSTQVLFSLMRAVFCSISLHLPFQLLFLLAGYFAVARSTFLRAWVPYFCSISLSLLVRLVLGAFCIGTAVLVSCCWCCWRGVGVGADAGEVFAAGFSDVALLFLVVPLRLAKLIRARSFRFDYFPHCSASFQKLLLWLKEREWKKSKESLSLWFEISGSRVFLKFVSCFKGRRDNDWTRLPSKGTIYLVNTEICLIMNLGVLNFLFSPTEIVQIFWLSGKELLNESYEWVCGTQVGGTWTILNGLC